MAYRVPKPSMLSLVLSLLVATSASARAQQDIEPSCRSSNFSIEDLQALKTLILSRNFKASGEQQAETTLFFTSNRISLNKIKLYKGSESLVVYLSGSSLCGTSGCSAYVLMQTRRSQQKAADYKIVGKLVAAQTPIIALRSFHNGWRDLGVNTFGGGVAGGMKRISFSGTSYWPYPTTAPKVEPSLKGGVTLIASEVGGTFANGQCRLL